MEISIDETDAKLSRLVMNANERLSLCKAMHREEFYIETMCLSGHRRFPLGSANQTTRNRGMEIMKKAIILARDLGIRVIQLTGYDVFYETSSQYTQELFFENLMKSVALAAQYGVILAFETMETEFMNTVSKAMTWVHKVKSPYLQIYPDTGNLTNAAKLYQSDLLEDLKKGAGHIVAMHLKETVPGKYREIPFGTGHVPFRDLLAIAHPLGVRKFLAEFWYLEGQNWEKDIKFAASFLKNCLDEQYY